MNQRLSKPLLLVGLLFGLAASLSAQRLKIAPDQRYLLLATKKTSTMQKELDEAASKGFRVILGSPTSGTEVVLFLERVATPEKPYRYLLLATSRTGTMNKELNQAAEENFRLIPSTMIQKKRMMGSPEVLLVLERPPDAKDLYQYKLLATNRTSTMQKEVAEAREEGFELVGLVSRGEHMVIMEKKIE
ncbi:MAG: hypothetical protein V3T83_06740 [Acidobacteriota bacterium]